MILSFKQAIDRAKARRQDHCSFHKRIMSLSVATGELSALHPESLELYMNFNMLCAQYSGEHDLFASFDVRYCPVCGKRLEKRYN